MVYFTDMLLIPGDGGSGSEELKQALNGSGMIRCAQVANDPDLVIDYGKSVEGGEYVDAVDAKVKALMDERQDVDYDTGGAWGGPGGVSEAWGVSKNEPEVTVRIPYGEVIVRLTNIDPFYREQSPMIDQVHDWFVGNVGPHNPEDGLVWDVEEVPGAEDTFRIFWKEDPNWKPEAPEPDFDDYDY